jgi:glycosyltransferase involved in cell wall biosynthesis
VQLLNVKPTTLTASWGWSKQLSVTFQQLFRNQPGTVMHVHGVWGAPQWVAARHARARGIPFVVSDHGMLAPWFWNYKGTGQLIKKTLYWRGMARPAFRHASAIHAVTTRERDWLARLLPYSRFEVIPNAVDVSQIDSSSKDESTANPHNIEPFFLFVGRLDPQKGVDLLISAFAHARLPSGFRLVVAGPSPSKRYREELLKLASTRIRNQQIVFAGPVYGLEKWRLYRSAWAVIVPSRFESLGLVNLEAAACNTPTITTRETGLESWADNGGLLIRAHADDLRVALERVASWGDSERRERGASMRRLVEEQYSWTKVREKWYALYDSLLSAG